METNSTIAPLSSALAAVLDAPRGSHSALKQIRGSFQPAVSPEPSSAGFTSRGGFELSPPSDVMELGIEGYDGSPADDEFLSRYGVDKGGGHVSTRADVAGVSYAEAG